MASLPRKVPKTFDRSQLIMPGVRNFRSTYRYQRADINELQV